jgi:hypothetical protein
MKKMNLIFLLRSKNKIMNDIYEKNKKNIGAGNWLAECRLIMWLNRITPEMTRQIWHIFPCGNRVSREIYINFECSKRHL